MLADSTLGDPGAAAGANDYQTQAGNLASQADWENFLFEQVAQSGFQQQLYKCVEFMLTVLVLRTDPVVFVDLWLKHCSQYNSCGCHLFGVVPASAGGIYMEYQGCT